MALIDFIIKAKLSGYASGSDEQKKTFNDGSLGFEMISDGYRYLDRYNGFNPFVGSEHVYGADNALVWVMNYYGQILHDGADCNRIYSVLKESILQITPDYPFRGPAEFMIQNFRYKNLQNGSLDHFHGIESIYENNEKVYVLYYHGGKIN